MAEKEHTFNTMKLKKCWTLTAQFVAYRTWEQVIGSIPGFTNFFLGINGSQCARIHSSVTADHCFISAYKWESSHWLGYNIMWTTSKQNSKEAWIGALATRI